MNALLLALFVACAAMALATMVTSVKRYAGMAMALGAQLDAAERPRRGRKFASRYRVKTPRPALARGKMALCQARLSPAMLAGEARQGVLRVRLAACD